jgi:hypothetical protein
MDRALALMGLGGVMRQAIRLIKGVQISQDQQAFEMAVFSVFAWFKVGPAAGLHRQLGPRGRIPGTAGLRGGG